MFPYVGKVCQGNIRRRNVEFELVTVLAILWFSNKKCHIVVFEVGVGEDSHQCDYQLLVSVLTSVSMDHTEVLGDTQKITTDKCGNYEANRTFVVAPCQKAEVMPIVKEEAEKEGQLFIEAFMNDIQLLHTEFKRNDFCIMAVHYTCR